MATVDEAFDASFNAGKASVQASAAVPISQFQQQATFAQATKINSFNALEAAITNNTNVQKQRADNADTISLAAAEASNKTALEVAEIAKQGIQAVEVGRQGLVQASLSAINAQKELSAIQANKPNAILHPIRWVADTLQSNKLEDAIQTHSKAVQVYNRNINNVVQNTTVQVEEMLSIQNLVNSNGLRLQAAELNKGLDAQQAVATGQKEKATALDAVGGELFAVAKANAEWAQADYRNQLAAEQNKIGKRANELAAEKMQREADAAKYRDGAIKQAANFYLLAKNLPPTESNRNMAMSMMTDMQAKGDPTFVAWSKAGAHAINSGDSKSAFTAVVQGSTVGEIAQLGALTGNADLAAIGGNQVNQLTQQNEAALRKSSYMATLPAGKEFTQAGFDIWAGSLKAPQNADFKARAVAMAKNVVYNQSARSYMNGRAAGKDIGQGAFSLAAFKSPLTLVNTYGISKQAATVLADPKVQMFLAHAGAGSTQDKKTAQIVAMFEVLEKNKVANPAGVVALIGKKTGEAALDSDLEAKTLGQYGIVSDGSGTITYKGEKYRLGNPVDMDRMRIAATKKDDTFFNFSKLPASEPTTKAKLDAKAMQNANDLATMFTATLAKDVLGITERNPVGEDSISKAKRESINSFFGLNVPYTQEQAALTASKYTPAGHAPQVSGGVPATALTEADKVYAEVEAKLVAADVRKYTLELQDSVAADVAYEQASQQIEQKNARDYTNKLFAEIRAADTSSSKDTTQAVKKMEAAIKDGNVTGKQAVPVVKKKVQEAKKAGDEKAESRWDELLNALQAPPPDKDALTLDLREPEKGSVPFPP